MRRTVATRECAAATILCLIFLFICISLHSETSINYQAQCHEYKVVV
jgi:hypothetical protein